MPARYIFLDEVDAYPASADEEGDLVTLAAARTITFSHRRKVFMVSTPTIRGLFRIEREFEASDQRRYFVPRPHCGAMQWLHLDWLRWDKGQLDTAAYHCQRCETPTAEHHKTQMLARGEWQATVVSVDPIRSAFTCRRSIRRWAGRAGRRSRGTGWPRKAQRRCCARRETPC